jgi:hypothetical protein
MALLKMGQTHLAQRVRNAERRIAQAARGDEVAEDDELAPALARGLVVDHVVAAVHEGMNRSAQQQVEGLVEQVV